MTACQLSIMLKKYNNLFWLITQTNYEKEKMWLSLCELEPGGATVIKNSQLTEVSETKTVLGPFILAIQNHPGSGLSIAA